MTLPFGALLIDAISKVCQGGRGRTEYAKTL